MKIATYGYLAVSGDFIHYGHIRAMNECKKYCKKLIIGLHSDESIKEYKGRYPIQTLEQRYEVIRSLRQVYMVLEKNKFEYDDVILCMKKRHPDDFLIFDSPEHNREGADIIIPRTPGISSTMKKERMKCHSKKKKKKLT